MDITISGQNCREASLPAISSKSYVHRLLIASALSAQKCFLKTNILSDDMKATAGCLRSMGALIRETEEGFFTESPISSGSSVSLDCGESGSTARFLLPLASCFHDEVSMTGHGRLTGRPFGPLCDAMRENGTDVSADFLPLRTAGKLKSGVYRLPGDVSSQFITGLLMTLPLCSGDSAIELTSPLASKEYVEITLEVLRGFGIAAYRTESGFDIPGGQVYQLSAGGRTRISMPPQLQSVICAEGDWSNGGFLLCLGAVGRGITLTGLNPASVQGDRAVLSSLRSFGAEVAQTGDDSFRVSPAPLHGVDLNGSDIPDLIPALAAVAAFAEGESVFRNIGRLRLKESDRIESVTALLGAAGADAFATEHDGITDLRVRPVSLVSGKVPETLSADGANDHRIVMAAAILAAGSGASVTIKGAEAVNKSYPGFFQMCRDVLGMEVICHSQ